MKTLYSSALLFLVVVASVANVSSTEVYSCYINQAPLLGEVEIEDCDASPCAVSVGSTKRVSLKFTAPRDLESFSPSGTVLVEGDMVFNYPISDEDPCSHLENSRCPIKEGDEVVYNLDLETFIPETVPVSYFQLEVALKADGEAFDCFGVDFDFGEKV